MTDWLADWHIRLFDSLRSVTGVQSPRRGADWSWGLLTFTPLCSHVSRSHSKLSQTRSSPKRNFVMLFDCTWLLWVNVSRGISGYKGLRMGGGGAFSRVITVSRAASRVHTRTHINPAGTRSHAHLPDLLWPFSKSTRSQNVEALSLKVRMRFAFCGPHRVNEQMFVWIN